MADGDAKSTDTEAAEASGSPARGRRRLLLFALAGIVLLGSGVGAAWYLGFLPLFGEGGDEAAVAAEVTVPEQPALGALRGLEPFVANLADEEGTRYVKVTVQVEFYDAEPPPDLDARVPIIRDLVLTLLGSKRFADIRTPEGKEQLREEIINRINRAFDRDVTKNVYFTEFIVQ